MNIADKKLFSIVIVFAALSVLIAIAIWMLDRKADQNQQIPISTHSTTGTKIYTNTEYGFEFQHPENWTFHANTFYSPFSNFNLVGAPSGEDYQLDPPILVNIVTPDFADRAVISRKNLGAAESDIVVGSIVGIKYRYMEEYPRISIDIPVGEFRMILGSRKPHEDVFSQIIASFKFLK